MKKILFISLYWYPKLGWVENHIHRLRLEFLKKWYQIYTICWDSENVWSDDYNFRLIPFFHTKILTINLFFSFQLFFYKNRVLFNDVEVIHIHDPWMIFWIFPQLFFSKLRNKIYITFHWWGWIYPLPIIEKIIFKIASFLTKKTWAIYVWEFIDKYFGLLNKNKICIYWWVDKDLIDKNKNINETNFILSNRKKILFFWRLEQDLDFQYFIEFVNSIDLPINYEILIVWDWSLKSLLYNLNKDFIITFTWRIYNPYFFIKNSDYIFTSWYLWILESLYLNKKVVSFYSNNLKKDYLNYKTPFKDNLTLLNIKDKNNINLLLHFLDNKKYIKQYIPTFWDICEKYLALYSNKK